MCSDSERSGDRAGSARALLEEALELRDGGSLDAALALSLEAVNALEHNQCANAAAVADALIVLGWVYEGLTSLDDAERAFRRSLEIAEGLPATTQERAILRVRALEGLAVTYRTKGLYESAETLFRRALANAKAAFGPDALPVADLLSGLAMTFKYSGRFDEAERLYGQALVITERILGRCSVEVASLYHNLGGLEHARGNYAAAEPLARRAVELRAQTLGTHRHPDLASDQAALAAILDALGHDREAEALLREATDLLESVYGERRQETAVNLNNLAASLHKRGELAEAESLYRRALAIKESLLGPDHPELAATLNNLAVLCRSQARYREANSLLRRSLAVLQHAVAPNHPTLIACLENFAALQRLTGDATEGGETERLAALHASSP